MRAEQPYKPVKGRGLSSLTALRFAARELRGGLRGFYVFLACIALGVAAIAGVNTVSTSLTRGLASEGQTILGGDVALSLVHREASAEQIAFMRDRGDVSTIGTLRAMAIKPASAGRDQDQALVEIKAVDNAYPLYGAVEAADLASGQTRPADLADDLGLKNGRYGVLIEQSLMARLSMKSGDQIRIGQQAYYLAGAITQEPDRLSSGFGFAPRVLMSDAGLAASKLVQPGSLITWHYRIKLPDGREPAVRAFIDASKAAYPDAGWRIRSRANAAPGLATNIRRFALFLTLVGLTALVVGGVGVANAVRAHMDTKRESIATYKVLGATGSFIVRLYGFQILLLSGLGIAIGLAIGFVLPMLATAALADLLPFAASETFHWQPLGLAALYGVLVAFAFALWPLVQAQYVPVSVLYRDEARRMRVSAGAIVVLLGLMVAIAGLVIGLADDKRIAIIFLVAMVAVFIVLRLVASLIMVLARRLPRPKRFAWRLALANIHRPNALTPSVVLSLGLGLALLVTLALLDGNLRRTLTDNLPEQAPSFFFVDIQNADASRFDALIKQHVPTADLVRVPMLRGRLTHVKGQAADTIKAPPSAAWVFRGDRGITYSADLPDNSTLVSGDWWPKDYSGKPLVSFDAELADELGLTIGDMLRVNVLGRPIDVTIANLRTVEWESLGINFVMVFSPNTFAGAPHTHLATITFAGADDLKRDAALQKAVAKAFPSVTTVRVKDALDAVNALVGNLALGIRGASLITLVASILVLGGALAAGHRNRIYDAVILKTLGATRGRLVGAFALEYALLGLITAAFAILAGAIAAWAILTYIMNLGFVMLPVIAGMAALSAVVLTVGFGLVGTWSALGAPVAGLLKTE